MKYFYKMHLAHVRLFVTLLQIVVPRACEAFELFTYRSVKGLN